MQLTQIHVRRFRNIESLAWQPSPGLNLIVGDNGQGKTNLLEAIYLSLLGRSFRTSRDEECLPWPDPDQPRKQPAPEVTATAIEAELTGRLGSRNTKVTIGRGWKRVYRDEQLLERLGDLWEGASVVVFSPADVDLFRDAPSRRRRFIDLNLCQTSRLYMENLGKYQRALKQVNTVLKMRQGGSVSVRAQAEAYYPILGGAGAFLMQTRAEHLAALDEICAMLFNDLGGSGRLKVQYAPNLRNAGDDLTRDELLDNKTEKSADSSVAGDAGALTARLREYHEESERMGMLVAGPHRDDFKTKLAKHDLGKFGSQGQHRLGALTLKLGSAMRIEERLSDPPILLLDDFGSELDASRRLAILESLRGRMQVFVTATQPSDLGPDTPFDEVKRVEAGRWA